MFGLTCVGIGGAPKSSESGILGVAVGAKVETTATAERHAVRLERVAAQRRTSICLKEGKKEEYNTKMLNEIRDAPDAEQPSRTKRRSQAAVCGKEIVDRDLSESTPGCE
ncbi:hypothetical protein HRR90_004775 [Exophiala dermatitidis]|uniref:Uncharacterized protein n=1 Tax=Exophiala dermatitidis TaxID=5970 RepID=A0AAN6EVU9_EXODE|nr:hypothetical protein HRR74_004770 [Exophiala dermatitidis]KAJ4534394.1 hypothetical protein HRR76_006320 [Exophiala dermatitidis]KAJ4573313.1 hypothetical protein HRR81_004800 [Exophiala dermatitidis]KAJ4595280.1 hypothetical protein HRR84_005487 [Exophiala dermatitidis]KAJ4622558.1 hypothetical protein HRR88_005571 [Exophiala dermatitidis]